MSGFFKIILILLLKDRWEDFFIFLFLFSPLGEKD
jgi:hypothetical protein